jgi:predicted nucleic acid-binding protein
LARHAGILRFAVERSGGRRIPGGIDAIVAAHAAAAGSGLVFTTDPSDLRRLLADDPGVRVEKP